MSPKWGSVLQVKWSAGELITGEKWRSWVVCKGWQVEESTSFGKIRRFIRTPCKGWMFGWGLSLGGKCKYNLFDP